MKVARPVRRAGRGNGPVERPAPRPGPTQHPGPGRPGVPGRHPHPGHQPRAHKGGRGGLNGGLGLLPLTVPEVRRLLVALVWTTPVKPGFVLAWSRWRRRHQAPGRHAHYHRRERQVGGSGTGAVPPGRGPFPVPARQTVHAVLPHTAYRRSSPAAFGPLLATPVPEGSGRNDGSIEADQAHLVGRQEQLFQSPSPGSSTVAFLDSQVASR